MASACQHHSGRERRYDDGLHGHLRYADFCINTCFSASFAVRDHPESPTPSYGACVIVARSLKGRVPLLPLPTTALFIGLILGSVPMILKQNKARKPAHRRIVFARSSRRWWMLRRSSQQQRGHHAVGGQIIKLFCWAASRLRHGHPRRERQHDPQTLGYYERSSRRHSRGGQRPARAGLGRLLTRGRAGSFGIAFGGSSPSPSSSRC